MIMRSMRGRMRSFFLVVVAIFGWATMALGQTAGKSLQEYANDSLGIRLLLPCTPTLTMPEFPGSEPSLTCTGSGSTVVINSSPQVIRSKKELDAFLEKGVQVEGVKVRKKRMRIHGKGARQISFPIQGMRAVLCIIARTDDILSVAVVEPAGRAPTVGAQVIRSIRLY